MRTIPLEAAARLFLSRQHLDRPLGRELNARSLAEFVSDAGGLQLDSINVAARAHELTLWSRFGAYDRAELSRLVYERRALFEYWCDAAEPPAWRIGLPGRTLTPADARPGLTLDPALWA